MSNTISVNPTTGALSILGGIPINSPQLPTFPLSVPNGGTGATALTGIVKGNGVGAFVIASAGVDYLAPAGSGAALTGITAAQVGALPLPTGATVSGANLTLGGTLTLTNPIYAASGPTGSPLNLIAGSSSGYVDGAPVNISGGTSSARYESGGGVNITGGTAGGAGVFIANRGGSIIIEGGAGTAPGNGGGNVQLIPGTGSGMYGALNGVVGLCSATTQLLSFYGAAGTTQPTVTGSKASGAALASLLSKLVSLGLIVDGTST